MKRITIYLCCIVMFVSVSASAQDVWSLDDCIRYANDNKIDIARQRNEIEIRRIQLQKEKNSYVPTVEANFTPSFSTGMNMDVFIKGNFLYLPASISGNMPLVNIGIVHNRKASEYALKAGEARMEQTKQDVAIAVAAYYLQTEYAKSALSLAEDMVRIDLENLDYVKTCLSEGSVSENEKTKAELALASDEKNVVEAKGLVEQSLLELQYFINSPEPFEVTEPDIPEVVSSSISTESLPGVIAREYELQTSKSVLEAAKSSWYPSISLFASAGAFTCHAYTNKEAVTFDKSFWSNRNAIVGLSLNVPIIDKSTTRMNVKAKRIEVQDCQMALDDTRKKYEEKIALIQSKLMTARESAEKLAAVVEKADENYQAEKARYEEGYSSWFDLQEAKKLYMQARIDELNSRTEYMVNSKNLEIYLSSKL